MRISGATDWLVQYHDIAQWEPAAPARRVFNLGGYLASQPFGAAQCRLVLRVGGFAVNGHHRNGSLADNQHFVRGVGADGW